MKKYRFFFHYRHQTKSMSIHYRGKCVPVKEVICNAPCETKWNKTQPVLVMQGYSSNVEFIDNKVIIHE
jgi:hypothetical protein